jgi:hypothetical protein
VTVVEVKDLKIKQLMLRLSVTCSECHESFLFEGPRGFSTEHPTVSSDMKEVLVPMHWPLSQESEPEEIDKDLLPN